eukprot:scaffold257755_cov32-Tisochrysis_lutea.AAC.1
MHDAELLLLEPHGLLTALLSIFEQGRLQPPNNTSADYLNNHTLHTYATVSILEVLPLHQIMHTSQRLPPTGEAAWAFAA